MSPRSPRLGVVVIVALSLMVLSCSGGDPPSGAPSPLSPAGPPAVALTDGDHFGFVTDLDLEHLQLGFDEAKLLGGVDAERAAKADGNVVTRGGHYVDEAGGRSHRVRVSRDVEVRLLTPCCELHRVSADDWTTLFPGDTRTFFGTSKSHYRLTVVDGDVVKIDEVQVI